MLCVPYYALLKCGIILSVLFTTKQLAVYVVLRTAEHTVGQVTVILVRAAVTAGCDRWCIFRLVC